MLKQALAYLEYGWSIIPVHTIVRGYCTCGKDNCSAPGKHPRVNWADYTKRLPTKEEVVTWFRDEFPGSNIGLVTGTISNIMVVDCDGKQGVKEAKKKLSLTFPTLVALTGGGGFHCFYNLDGIPVASKRALHPMVDIKAERGFVVLPPSKHSSGYKYRWFRKNPISSDIDLSQFELERNGNEVVNGTGWYSELLKGVSEGDRSNAASKLAGRYANKGLDLQFLMYGMLEWNKRNQPPLPREELITTVRYIFNKNRADSEPERIETYGDLTKYLKKSFERGGRG